MKSHLHEKADGKLIKQCLPQSLSPELPIPCILYLNRCTSASSDPINPLAKMKGGFLVFLKISLEIFIQVYLTQSL